MTRHFKLLAAVAVVLVTISGFSPARSSGGKSGSSGSSSSGHSSRGGGCSSSDSSSHNTSTSSSGGSGSHDKGSGKEYAGDSSRRYPGGSNNSANGGKQGSDSRASGTVLKCAAAEGGDPSSSVRVRNSASAGRTYTVTVTFLDARGMTVDDGTARTTVARNGTRTVDVRMDDPALMDRVDRCRLKSVR